ncbi:SPP1 family phage portal protein [Limosilactobacillus coleohominis DSM 14060]|nr:SPP1 family phage portal protein [Limosilactobacillus coleohominis DSM 14060]
MKTVMKPDGKPLLDESGEPVKVPNISSRDPFIWLKPSFHDNANGTTVVPSSAQYLTKQLNEQGWSTYINQLITDIHKDTNTTTVSSGVALMYKLFGEDQERSMQESLYTRGIMRRLRLLGNYWQHNRAISDPSLMNNYKPDYHPNFPRNNADIVQMAVQLNQTELLSDQTLREFLATVTGISADAEQQRIDDEKEQDPDQDTYGFNQAPLQGTNPADLEEAKAKAEQLAGQSQPETPEEFIARMQRRGGNNAK